MAPGTSLHALAGPSVPAGAVPLQRTHSASQGTGGGGGGAAVMNGIGAAVLTGGGMPEAKRGSTTGLFAKLSLAAGGGSQSSRGAQSVR